MQQVEILEFGERKDRKLHEIEKSFRIYLDGKTDPENLERSLEIRPRIRLQNTKSISKLRRKDRSYSPTVCTGFGSFRPFLENFERRLENRGRFHLYIYRKYFQNNDGKTDRFFSDWSCQDSEVFRQFVTGKEDHFTPTGKTEFGI